MLDRAVRKRLHHALVVTAFVVLSARAAAASGFVYALTQVDSGPNKIYGFRIDEATGALTPIAGFPIDSGGNGSAAANSESIKYFNGRLYIINDGTDTLSAFTVSTASGALTPMPFSPISIGIGSWGCVAVHPSGSPVVVGDGNNTIASLVVTPTSATAASGSPYTTDGASPFSCAFSHDGNYVYTGGNSGTRIAAYSVSAGSGILTPLTGSSFDSGGGNPVAYAMDATGRLFSTNASANQVRVFTTPGGVPTGVTGNPFSAGGLNVGVAGVVHPSGFYMVADRNARVGVYRISGSGSATTLAGVAGSPFPSGGSFTDALTLTSAAGFLVAANGGTRNLTVFQVNTSTGSLTPVGVQPANTLGTLGRITGVTSTGTSSAAAAGDFDGDRKSDISVHRPSSSQWYILQSSTNYATFSVPSFGLTTDTIVPGDYDGDGKIDPAVFRSSTGTWFFLNSSTNYATASSVTLGLSTDVPVPGDYDGDGKTDPAIFRPSTGAWIVLTSGSNYTSNITLSFGLSTDKAVPADYDGDGKVDPAVFRASTGTWIMLQSSANYTTSVSQLFGLSLDQPVPADYDGDGKADPAIFRASTGTWFALRSSTNYTTSISASWGLSSDTPVPADYDGDGKADPAVYRSSAGMWFILKSSAGYTTSDMISWGAGTDTPINKQP